MSGWFSTPSIAPYWTSMLPDDQSNDFVGPPPPSVPQWGTGNDDLYASLQSEQAFARSDEDLYASLVQYWDNVISRQNASVAYDRQRSLDDLAWERSSAESQMNREFNQSEAQKNRDFQAYYTENAYQVAMRDLKAAGLNPALLFSQGSANTPSGAAATGTPATASSGSATSAYSARQARNYGLESARIQLAGSIVSSASRLFSCLIGLAK